VTWFKTDDGFSLHSKARAAGKDGRALWHTAGEGCAREDLDGVVPAHMLAMYGSLAEVDPKKAARALVKAGLWHTHDGLCEKCEDNREWLRVRREGDGRTLPELVKGDYYFHDWNEYQLDKDGKDDPIERKRSARRRELNRKEWGKAIVAQVRQRDQDRCRYCGVLTVWSVGRGGDTRSVASGTIDHVDPFDWVNSVRNCVVACRTCNGQKRDRTPEDWVADGGRPLRPAPERRTKGAPSENQSTDIGPGKENQLSDQALTRAPTRGGPGIGPGQDDQGPDFGRDETGTGP
jgi:hypothetical protein